MRRKLVWLAFLFLASDAVAALWINKIARGRIYSDAARIPPRRVGLILGCSRKLSSGRPNPFFEKRIDAGARLFRDGKVQYLIVSGDNHIAGYDEPSDMKRSLIAAGVPASRIYRDFAGFHTLDSVVRAKAVFGQDWLTIVSQKSHVRRALFVARYHGVHAIGFAAPDPASGALVRLREQISKIGAASDVLLLHRKPKFLGPRIDVI